MPFAMGGQVQSVAVRGVVYVGGGDVIHSEGDSRAVSDNDIMEFDIASEKWRVLPRYKDNYFAMTAIDNQLVLVGGYNGSQGSKELGVWTANEQWTHPYPEMGIARSRCSAAVFKKWLVVAGGWPDAVAEGNHGLTSVEIMNTAEKRWWTGPSTPKPCFCMTAVVVKDMYYLMGGYTNIEKSVILNMGYGIKATALVESRATGETWNEISSPLDMKYPSPVSFCGSLLAVGGVSKVRTGQVDSELDDSNLIHCYKPSTKEWVKIGNLPTPRRKCSCVQLEDGRILVAGGNNGPETFVKTVDIYELAP